MDNYINLAELRQVAESLLYKINTIADTKVDNYNVIVNEPNMNDINCQHFLQPDWNRIRVYAYAKTSFPLNSTYWLAVEYTKTTD